MTSTPETISAWNFLNTVPPYIYAAVRNRIAHESSTGNRQFDKIVFSDMIDDEASFLRWLEQQETLLRAMSIRVPDLCRHNLAFTEADTTQYLLQYCLSPVCYIQDRIYHNELTAALILDSQQMTFLAAANRSFRAIPDWTRCRFTTPLGEASDLLPSFIVEVKHIGHLDFSEAFFTSTSWERMSQQVNKYFATGAKVVALTDYENIILLRRVQNVIKCVRGERPQVKSILLYGLCLSSNAEEPSTRHHLSTSWSIESLLRTVRELALERSPGPVSLQSASGQGVHTLRRPEFFPQQLLVLSSRKKSTFDRPLSPGVSSAMGQVRRLIMSALSGDESVAVVLADQHLSRSTSSFGTSSFGTSSLGTSSSKSQQASSLTSAFLHDSSKNVPTMRKHASNLASELHDNASIAVVVEKVFQSSRHTQVVQASLVSDKVKSEQERPSAPSNPSFILKFQGEEDMNAERFAYTTLQAEQGDLIPHYYGELQLNDTGLRCMALELVKGTKLDKLNGLQTLDEVETFIHFYRYRWLTLLAYNMRHSDLVPRNIVMTANGPCFLDFNYAMPLTDPTHDATTLETSLYEMIKGEPVMNNAMQDKIVRRTRKVWDAICAEKV